MIKARYIAIIVGIILFGAVLGCRAEEENLLKNGSFEQGTEGWALNPAFEAATVEIVTGQPGRDVHSGSKAKFWSISTSTAIPMNWCVKWGVSNFCELFKK